MRFVTAIGVAVVGFGIVSSASAADLPRKYTKAPAMAPIAYNWTGLFLGVTAGYGWIDSGSAGTVSGFVGGGQIGYNWQAAGSPLVLGIEGDFQGADLSDSATALGITATARSNAFGTVRGRLGYAWDRFMLYGTGGWAYTRTELSATNGTATVSTSDWSSGYALGGGIEWAAWDRWSVKAEYLYVHSGDVNLTLAGVPVNGNYNINLVRAGLNYRF
jgi:outer membrane immunogenic protein